MEVVVVKLLENKNMKITQIRDFYWRYRIRNGIFFKKVRCEFKHMKLWSSSKLNGGGRKEERKGSSFYLLKSKNIEKKLLKVAPFNICTSGKCQEAIRAFVSHTSLLLLNWPHPKQKQLYTLNCHHRSVTQITSTITCCLMMCRSTYNTIDECRIVNKWLRES